MTGCCNVKHARHQAADLKVHPSVTLLVGAAFEVTGADVAVVGAVEVIGVIEVLAGALVFFLGFVVLGSGT